jgi:pimeloyl-ACP methyl ester carboxylesterase
LQPRRSWTRDNRAFGRAGGSVSLLPLEPRVVRVGGRRRKVECGVMTVPERRGDPSSRTIEVPIMRLPAETPDLNGTPVFRLGGGPGMSNMGFVPPAALGGYRDVVLVGYRGVDGSTTLACPEVVRALRHAHGDVLGEESCARVAHAASAAARRLNHDGVDVAGYTVAEVLADLEDARAALGHDRIDLLSESYGTRLALLYAQGHPDRVARSVLLGVNPPGRFVWDPAIVDAQLADWGALWAASGNGNRHPDLAQTMSRALERLPRRWLGARIDPGKARIVTFVLLFQRRNGLMAIDAWEAAARGDPSGVLALSLAFDVFVPSSFTWGDFMAKAFSVDYDASRNYREWLDRPDAVLGSPVVAAVLRRRPELAGHARRRRATTPAHLRGRVTVGERRPRHLDPAGDREARGTSSPDTRRARRGTSRVARR